MSEAILTFQSQLSGVMETVFKAAMYEITRLVEDSFLEEVTRSREQVESLKKRLQWSENRRSERDREGDRRTRCADCGKVGGFGEETERRPPVPQNAPQTGAEKSLGLKQERAHDRKWSSCESEAVEKPPEEEERGAPLSPHHPPRPADGDQLEAMLKEEALHIGADGDQLQERWEACMDGSTGHGKSFREPDLEQWGSGLDGGAEPGPGDLGQPHYRARYGLEEIGGFEKSGYAGSHILAVAELDGLSDSTARLGYASHYPGGDEGASEGAGHRLPAASPQRSRRSGGSNRLGSPAPSPRADDLHCLLINEDGYLQDTGALYAPQHRAGNSGSNLGAGAPDLRAGDRPGDGLFGGDAPSLRAARPAAPFACDQCGKTFTQACNLKVHQRVHSADGLHLCSHCGKGFGSFGELRRHRCGHAADKPYGCALCGNRFSRLWNLKLHRRIHTQEKPHRCALCDKSFTRADILKVHQRTHTGERPYRCAVCGLSFKRLDHLKSHQRKHQADFAS